MKGYVIGFLFGVVFTGWLCVVASTLYAERPAPLTQVSATLVQWTEAESEDLFFEERALRDFMEPPLRLPTMPRFRPAPPIYNWQLPCP